VLFTAAPADADTSQGFIAGSGTVTDDWNDEGTLSTNQNSVSGAVMLWQWVLSADGAKYGSTTFGLSSIDGHFGADTKAATAYDQAHYLNLSDDDGIAGPGTFTAAGKHLSLYNTDPQCDVVRYSARSTRCISCAAPAANPSTTQ
jgi:hypothetical protein